MQHVRFRREVDGHQRTRLKRGGGRHIQNAAAGSSDHPGKIQAREMSQRRDVELDLSQTFFEIVVGKQAVLSESGVVDQNVNHDLRAPGLIENVSGGSKLGKVDRQNQRPRAMRLLYFGCQQAEFVNAARDQNEVVTFTGENTGKFQSNAGGSTSDEGGFAIGHRISLEPQVTSRELGHLFCSKLETRGSMKQKKRRGKKSP